MLNSRQAGWSGVYLLFSRTSEYIGKANLTRRKTRGPLGFSARCLEHFRALRHPQTAEGRMGRYKHLRISISVRQQHLYAPTEYGIDSARFRTSVNPSSGPDPSGQWSGS